MTSPRTVLIIGTQSNGSLESSYGRAFEAIGWQVAWWNPDLARHAMVRGGRLGQLFSTFVDVDPWLRKANLQLLQQVAVLQPDLLLVIATDGVRAGTLAHVRSLSPRTVLYCVFPDSLHQFKAERLLSLPLFDRFTVASSEWIAPAEQLGAPQVVHLPFAADPVLHRPLAPTSQMPHWEVGFIGTWRHEREELLERLAGFELTVWGNRYWRTRVRRGSPLPKRWSGRAAQGSEFAQVCANTAIMLNIVEPMTWPGPNMRTFELAACGAFTLSTRTPAVLELFQEHQTVVCFDTIEEAQEQIRYYVAHPGERQRIAAAAYALVTRQGHTYVDRARQLVAWWEQDRRG